jgi:tRNA1(Val) A37 N6-methylase TrmN6
MAEPEITEDALYGGRIRIRQPKRGYRVNLDTLLLAAAISPLQSGARVAELCCGVGAALLAVAASNDADVTFTGVEREPIYAALARENVELNGQAHRARIIEADALEGEFGQFDHVFFNPPYDGEGEGRAPAENRRAAHIADRPFEDWIKVWSNRMSGDATLTLIHRAHKLGEILAALGGRLGGFEIVPVRPYADANASRVIVRARKGSRAPLKLCPGLTLHPSRDVADKYTPQTEAILRGETRVNFG